MISPFSPVISQIFWPILKLWNCPRWKVRLKGQSLFSIERQKVKEVKRPRLSTISSSLTVQIVSRPGSVAANATDFRSRGHEAGTKSQSKSTWQTNFKPNWPFLTVKGFCSWFLKGTKVDWYEMGPSWVPILFGLYFQNQSQNLILVNAKAFATTTRIRNELHESWVLVFFHGHVSKKFRLATSQAANFQLVRRWLDRIGNSSRVQQSKLSCSRIFQLINLKIL